MATTVFTPDRLFAELQPTFDDYHDFEQAFVERFNVHRFDFPVGYSWRDVLNWGLQNGLVRREGHRIVIRIDLPTHA